MPRVLPDQERNPVIRSFVGMNVPGGAARRMAFTSIIAAAVAGVISAPASVAASATPADAAIRVPSLSDSCDIPSFASVHYLIQSGHAISGTWTLAPRFSCDRGKTSMSISVTLRRNGAAQLASSGFCQRKALTLCTTALGPRRTKSYSTAIRGTWTASVQYSFAGQDAVLFARSPPRAGTCTYKAVKT